MWIFVTKLRINQARKEAHNVSFPIQGKSYICFCKNKKEKPAFLGNMLLLN